MDYYLQWECPDCGTDNFEGINRTLLTHNGLPAIPYDDGATHDYTCANAECGKTFYSGDCELWEAD